MFREREVHSGLVAILGALTLSGCAPVGYKYEVGNFIRPHPTQELCASRGQVLDMRLEDCAAAMPTSVAAPTAEKSFGANMMRGEAAKQNALADLAFSRVSSQGNDFINNRMTCKVLWDQSPNADDDLSNIISGFSYRITAVTFNMKALQEMGADHNPLKNAWNTMGYLREKAQDCEINRN
jgi:hypothetical protein